MDLSYPITVIVRHPRENPRKCSILPLKGRPDLLFLTYPLRERPDLAGYVRLAAEGPPLSTADAERGLLLLDGSWRWAGEMTRDFRDVPPRSLEGYRTAYPRVSKQGTDPDNGLATVEALFLAYHLLGQVHRRITSKPGPQRVFLIISPASAWRRRSDRRRRTGSPPGSAAGWPG
jgi:pre-rRNA-processing protein TSR3